MLTCANCGSVVSGGREYVRTMLRGVGLTLSQHDSVTDWFSVPESAEDALYANRDKIPFNTRYCAPLPRVGGFIVYYDQPE